MWQRWRRKIPERLVASETSLELMSRERMRNQEWVVGLQERRGGEVYLVCRKTLRACSLTKIACSLLNRAFSLTIISIFSSLTSFQFFPLSQLLYLYFSLLTGLSEVLTSFSQSAKVTWSHDVANSLLHSACDKIFKQDCSNLAQTFTGRCGNTWLLR